MQLTWTPSGLMAMKLSSGLDSRKTFVDGGVDGGVILTSARWKPWRLFLEWKEGYRILVGLARCAEVNKIVGLEEERKKREDKRRREVVAGRRKLVGGGLPLSTSVAGCVAVVPLAAGSPEWTLGLKRGPRGGVQAW